MARRKTEQAPPLFTATGDVKGRTVTVRVDADFARHGTIGDAVSQLLFTRTVWESLPDNPATPIEVHGNALPCAFIADGFGFPVRFVVSQVVNPKKKPRYSVGIVGLQLGHDSFENPDGNVLPYVDPTLISTSALLRLAVRASSIVGVVYPRGTLVDMQGHVLAHLEDGDPIPPDTNFQSHGVTIERNASGRQVVRYGGANEPRVIRAGEGMQATTVRTLLGEQAPGRKRGPDGMFSTKNLRLVADLYRRHDSEALPGEGRPAFAKRKLEEIGLVYSESWVRQVAIESRRRGILKQGARKKGVRK